MKTLLVAFAAFFITTADAQTPVSVVPYVYTALGYQQISSLSSATLLTVPMNPNGTVAAKIAEICVETQAIRYRDDGTAPTSSVGIPVSAGTCFQYSASLGALQIIQQSSGAVVDVAYYK